MRQVRTLTYTIFVMLYLLKLFIDNQIITVFLGFLSILILFISFRGANRTFQYISIFFLLAGTALFIRLDFSLLELPYFMTSSALLLSLLYFLPCMDQLIRAGGYDDELKKLLHFRTSNLGELYTRSSLIGYVLCLFVFFSAITIVHDVVKEVTPKMERDVIQRLTSESVLRSFALANVWSPIEIFLALTITITGVDFFHILPWALLFSLSLLCVDWVKGWLKYRNVSFNASDPPTKEIDQKDLFYKIGNLFFMLFLFILSAAGVETWLKISYFNAVILTIFPFTLLWAGLIGKFKAFVNQLKQSWSIQVNGLQNLMLLFLSLGFFGVMFEQSSLSGIVKQPIQNLAEWPLILFLSIQIISLSFSLIGIHPLVTITLMGTFVQPILTELNPLSIALVLLTSTLASDAAGTFNTTVSIMSQLTCRNPYRITKWNIWFALGFGTAGSLLAWLLL
ncbi:hypothetical protein [Thalassobacillus pellis]|uniref:hypothetical protein n=1 Tax=Thalassobacillus pellis TaxID=748008 RepID=UPI00196042D7|nr:hypothetical protein [Thalassobacillus pellis]MBM7553722.1 hypothetical protein [Thalassobacillus pellis]